MTTSRVGFREAAAWRHGGLSGLIKQKSRRKEILGIYRRLREPMTHGPRSVGTLG